MSIDDLCISEGTSDCKGCDGYDEECIGYIPGVYNEMYEATAIDRVMETYQSLKTKVKKRHEHGLHS